MTINPQLLMALANPTSVAIADDAAAAAALSVPTYTPLTTAITYAALCDVWGTTLADQVFDTLQAIALDPTNPVKPAAASALRVLGSTGFFMSSSVSRAAIATLVAAGLVTQDQANAATCSVSYPAGYSPVLTADVTAARAQMALNASIVSMRDQVSTFYRYAIDTALAATITTVPAFDDIVAAWKAAPPQNPPVI